MIVDSPKDIGVLTSSKTTAETPPVIVTAINLKTVINEKQNVNEIVSASVICCHKAKVCSKTSAGLVDTLYYELARIFLVWPIALRFFGL